MEITLSKDRVISIKHYGLRVLFCIQKNELPNGFYGPKNNNKACHLCDHQKKPGGKLSRKLTFIYSTSWSHGKLYGAFSSVSKMTDGKIKIEKKC